MASNPVSNNVLDHGILVNEQKKRVKCNYCDKVVTGITRLKHHLGGIRGDVVPCLEVPLDVKTLMKSSVSEKMENKLSREVLHLFESDAPFKDNPCAKSAKESQAKSIRPLVTGKRKHTVIESVPKGYNSFPCKTGFSQKAAKSKKCEDDSATHAQKCIGRFFYENGIDVCNVESSSFREMINAVIQLGSPELKAPNCNELEGCIFQEEIENIHNYVNEVRQSWGSTGCSILLDGWTDEKGRNLVNFLADCPRGAIYLKSAVISNSLKDVNALISVLDEVLEEVGVKNVVQVITYNTSGFMEAVGKQLVEKRKSMFWAVCASHCICLMLEKIGMIFPIKEVLSKAKIIVDFIYGHARVLKLMRMCANGRDLVNPAHIGSVKPFLTLECIVAQELILKHVIGSTELKATTLTSTHDWRQVADLMKEPSFWSEARMVLKATIPLVRALNLISGGDDKPQVGFIYETMDQTKEAIKKEFYNDESQYIPLWEIIDEIWDNQLHSPLHSAGYFLNPAFFYSSDFYSDAEVASGLLCCIVRMVEDRGTQDLISFQLDAYREATGSFGHAKAIDQRNKVPPAEWWSLYGGHCPELQKFAIRILSQTCSGGIRFYLKRSLSEQLYTNGRTKIDQQRVNDQTYLGHNLRLHHSSSGGKNDDNHNIHEDADPMVDRIVKPENPEKDEQQGNALMEDVIAFMRSDQILIDREGSSQFQPKDEL